MKITPLEIRQKSFEKVFRGYDKDEVTAYLQSLSQEWERIMEENKDWKQKVDNLQQEVNKLREVENSLFKTLKTAEDTGATLIEQAKKETELHLKQSQIQSDQILNEARDKARKMVDGAESKTKQILDEMLSKVKTLEHHYHQVYDFREKIIAQLKNYADEISERNEKFEKRGQDLDVSDILTEAKKTYNESILDIETLSQKSKIAVEEIQEPEKEIIFEKEEEEKKEITFQVDIPTPESTEEEEHAEESAEPENKVNPEELKQLEEFEDSEEEEESIDAKQPESSANLEELEQPEEVNKPAKKKESSTTKSFFDEIDG